MWIVAILAAMAGLWVAKQKAGEIPITVTPKQETPRPKGKPILRLVKAVKHAVAYPSYPYRETINLGPNQTIAPLLDPGKLDEQAAQARVAGNTIEANRLAALAAQVRAAIVKKYNSDTGFAARVNTAKAKGA